MTRYSAGVIGASGYAGGELVRLIDAHPDLDLAVIAGHSAAGRPLGEVHPHLPDGERILQSQDEALAIDVDLMFLALPHGASAEPAVELVGRGIKVADLGADFRLTDPAVYAAAYGSPHPHPDQLGGWTYGLPELNRTELAGADCTAVPGCYPTAAVLALAPLAAGSLIDTAGIVVDAMSGVSGAGRGVKKHLTFGAVDEGVRAYAVGTHRHRPEMEQALATTTTASVRVSFTPHLVPMQRGLLTTCSAPVRDGVARDDLTAAFGKAYDDEVFVDVVPDPPQTRWVVGSNRCLVSVQLDEHSGRAIVTAAIDNLMKGAAGQAVQCANLMLGLEEPAGLTTAGWMP